MQEPLKLPQVILSTLSGLDSSTHSAMTVCLLCVALLGSGVCDREAAAVQVLPPKWRQFCTAGAPGMARLGGDVAWGRAPQKRTPKRGSG